MIRINNIKIYEDITNLEVFEFAINKVNIKKSDIIDWHISKNQLMLGKNPMCTIYIQLI